MGESFNATADDFEPLPLHKCDNCGLISAEDQLDMVRDYHERVDAGGVAPSGECPDCGALCYPVEGGYVNGLLESNAELLAALKLAERCLADRSYVLLSKDIDVIRAAIAKAEVR